MVSAVNTGGHRHCAWPSFLHLEWGGRVCRVNAFRGSPNLCSLFHRLASQSFARGLWLSIWHGTWGRTGMGGMDCLPPLPPPCPLPACHTHLTTYVSSGTATVVTHSRSCHVCNASRAYGCNPLATNACCRMPFATYGGDLHIQIPTWFDAHRFVL